MLNLHSAPERFSDISEVRDCQDFRRSILLMRRLAQCAAARFQGWNAQHDNGVSSIVRFSENADEFLGYMKKRIDSEIRECGQFGRRVDPETFKARMRREVSGIVENGVYRLQYELACMGLPPETEGKANGVREHGISEMFRASKEVSAELGAFLDSLNVERSEYVHALHTLRDFFLSRGKTNAQIKEDKQRLAAAFVAFMESYADFRLGAHPMSEGIVK